MTDTVIPMNSGDRATVTRGRNRGDLVEIVSFDPTEQQYAVKVVGSGKLTIVNHASLRAPDEPTVTHRALLAAFKESGLLDDEYADTVRVTLEKLGVNTDSNQDQESQTSAL